jgi:hypothetical protein
MENHDNSPNKRQGQDKHFKVQLLKVYRALLYKPMTMKEVDVFTGIMRENVCRHIDILREQGRIAVIRKRRCTITGWNNVMEFTADPNLFPKSSQLKMF